jgi:aminoglycoside 6'-N-acetyltransferase
MAAYGFRPMSAGDLPLVRDWLAQPHVAHWGRDADSEIHAPDGIALLMVRDA